MRALATSGRVTMTSPETELTSGTAIESLTVESLISVSKPLVVEVTSIVNGANSISSPTCKPPCAAVASSTDA